MSVQDARVTRAKKAIEAWLSQQKVDGKTDWSGQFSYNQYREVGDTLVFTATRPSGSFSYNLVNKEVKRL